MNKAVKKSVGTHLETQSNAKMLSHVKVGGDCALTIWTNDSGQVSYDRTEGHTFSFYLNGGQGVSRLDHGKVQGWPGSICVFPQGHSSSWEINERFEFLHVYLSDQELRRQFAQTFDKDARLLDVREHTFINSDQLKQAFVQLQNAAFDEDPMYAEEGVTSLLCEAMASDVLGEFRRPSLTGGLSPKNLKIVKDYVMANLDRPITLRELAALVNLSEYHFQRNFKAQCGVSPHVWMTHLRIDHSKHLMGQKQSLADISSACAFSSQSHFSRTFKSYTGMTPGAYLKNLHA
ncbi:AraC family transcriptional regulator [Terasakiella sp. A23]|uniref:AraC family transcriptional regulator n=1 Tax=Terasakiella sp. FCG-A23 TaxID=3080561 RepID=UPI002954B811|nr:AraC family transcriptional regulator [Terasakiella sp. A23]MDV7338911.1 AraC family transcriptional regulator [Terasakiella sp. A23]